MTKYTIFFRHFKQYSRIILEFLPQLLLLLFLFLYMVVMMFMKWILYSGTLDGWNPKEVNKHGTSCAPSVLIYFINMMLMGKSEPNEGCDTYMYPGQSTVQRILVFGALICIPWMLLGKPLYLMYTKGRKNNNSILENRISGEDNPGMDFDEVLEHQQEANILFMHHEETDEEDEPIGEVFIHQAIHTIEYTLGTISHTASYLRLWALSLAHAQLSEVLWSRLFHLGLMVNGYLGVVFIFIFFAVWAFFTVAILVLMEGLSAFLHTLRLHWVEFMSKFYVGLGYSFQPFSFKNILEEEAADY